MRYDTPVFFQKVQPGEYDSSTGDYGQEAITEDKRYASVTDACTNTMNLVYGAIKQGSLAIRIQNHYSVPFSRIRIGEKTYRVDFQRKLRNKQIFIVSEVQ